MFILENIARQKQMERLQTYFYAVDKMKKRRKNILDKVIEKESEVEIKIYRFLKMWEKKHPLLAIVLCTLLGAILLNLLTGVMVEAVIMMFP